KAVCLETRTLIKITVFLIYLSSNDTEPTAINTLSLHDALPIYRRARGAGEARPHFDRTDPRPTGQGSREATSPRRRARASRPRRSPGGVGARRSSGRAARGDGGHAMKHTRRAPRSRWWYVLVLCAVTGGTVSCAATPRPRVLGQADAAAESPAAREAAQLAPQAFAHAENLRAAAAA